VKKSKAANAGILEKIDALNDEIASLYMAHFYNGAPHPRDIVVEKCLWFADMAAKKFCVGRMKGRATHDQDDSYK